MCTGRSLARRALGLAAGLGLCLTIPAAGEATPAVGQPASLPVFKLRPPDISAAKERLAAASLNILGTKVTAPPERVKPGDKLVDIAEQSGSLWIADQALTLPNPSTAKAPSDLPEPDKAKEIAEQFLRAGNLVPQSAQLKVSADSLGETGAVSFTEGRLGEKLRFNVHVNYATEVVVEGQTLPIVGGGCEHKVQIGGGGRVIGYSGGCREIAGVHEVVAVIAREEAEATCRRRGAGLRVTRAQASLAYYSAPAFQRQEYLAPVYVCKAEIEVDGKKVPLRTMIIAATKYGPTIAPLEERKRPRDARPPAVEKEDPTERLKGAGASLTNEFLSLLGPRPAWAATGGTSWLDPGVGSDQNAKGFVDGLSAAGWGINFNWGDAAAWESDWRRNDDDWVDATDWVFYAGHASMNGWVLSNPDDGSLAFSEVGPAWGGAPQDLWGSYNAEWIIIAACGPHQSDFFVQGGGDVFARWGGVFDGLHQHLGYGSITFGTQDEGRRVTDLARDDGWWDSPMPVLDAWFRAATEIQPATNDEPAPDGPNVWVTAMYAVKEGVDPRFDYMWGQGSVSGDPFSPTTLWFVWQQT